MSTSSALAQKLEPHRRALWATAYRLLGTAADADDLVQDTMVRALERPPRDVERDVRPWLITVAMNLGRDRLRHRRRRQYVGPWLPSPLPDLDALLAAEATLYGPEPAAPAADLVASRKESLRFAAMVALESLTPNQRAVWILRDVLDQSTAETAARLEITEANVKTTLLRARRALSSNQPPTELGEEAEAAVGRLLMAVASHDLEAAIAALADGAVALSDGGGVYAAARHPVEGPDRVAKLLIGLAAGHLQGARLEMVEASGHRAVLVEFPDAKPPFAPRTVVMFDVDAAGRVHRVFSVLAPEKLTGFAIETAVPIGQRR